LLSLVPSLSSSPRSLCLLFPLSPCSLLPIHLFFFTISFSSFHPFSAFLSHPLF
jgi:hypothetical protein